MRKRKGGPVRWSNRIWQYLKKRRYSQKELARLLGYKSASNLSRWQNGSKLPTLEHAIALAVALSTSVDMLFPELRRSWEDRINPRRETLLSGGYQSKKVDDVAIKSKSQK